MGGRDLPEVLRQLGIAVIGADTTVRFVDLILGYVMARRQVPQGRISIIRFPDRSTQN
jgi:hypothetical protein